MSGIIKFKQKPVETLESRVIRLENFIKSSMIDLVKLREELKKNREQMIALNRKLTLRLIKNLDKSST